MAKNYKTPAYQELNEALQCKSNILKKMKTFKSCVDDVLKFAKFCTIATPNSFEPTPVDLYPWQKRALRKMQEGYDLPKTERAKRGKILLSSRQSGKTVAESIYALWFALFHPEVNVYICAPKLCQAKLIMEQIKQIHEHLPEHLKATFSVNNKLMIQFKENRSRIVACACDPSQVRGHTVDLLVVDDASFVRDLGEFFECYVPVMMTTNRQMVMSGVPSACETFRAACEAAKKPSYYFDLISSKWNAVPGRDDAWKKRMIRENGKKFFEQEYECKFPKV